MNIAPMQLETYFITAFHITTRHNFNPEKRQKYRISNLQSEVKYLVKKELPNVWQVPLAIRYTPQADENVPYGFSLSIVGFFKVHDKYPKDKMEQLVHFNAPAILFSAAREVLATMTGRGPWGTILLPSVNFLPKPERARPKTKKKRKKSTKQPPAGDSSMRGK